MQNELFNQKCEEIYALKKAARTKSDAQKMMNKVIEFVDNWNVELKKPYTVGERIFTFSKRLNTSETANQVPYLYGFSVFGR